MTIEQNLARYREMRANTEKAEQEGWKKIHHVKAEFAMANAVYSILRDLETAVEVIKVLREAVTELTIYDSKTGIGYIPAGALERGKQALALAAEKMGEPTSRSE